MKLEVSIKFLQSTDAPEELQTTRQGVFSMLDLRSAECHLL